MHVNMKILMFAIDNFTKSQANLLQEIFQILVCSHLEGSTKLFLEINSFYWGSIPLTLLSWNEAESMATNLVHQEK